MGSKRRVGLVVSTSDSESGIAASPPDEGTNTPMRNIIEQDVYSQVLRPTRPFIPPASGVDKQAPASAGD
jgi:hypothetical protein